MRIETRNEIERMIILRKEFEIIRENFSGNGYFIYRAKDLESGETVGLKGHLTKKKKGDVIKCTAELENHPTYGKQWVALYVHIDNPKTDEEKMAVMKNLLEGRQIASVLDYYKKPIDILQMVKDGSFEWEKIKYIGEVTYQKLVNRIENNDQIILICSALSDFGISESKAEKILEHYKSSEIAISTIKSNPYSLVDLSGIGFKTVDKIALEAGFDRMFPPRIIAASRYAMIEGNVDGSTYTTQKKFAESMSKLTGVEKDVINSFDFSGSMIFEEDRVYHSHTYSKEKEVARKVSRFLSQEVDFPLNKTQIAEFIDKYESDNGLTFTHNQKEFLFAITENNIVCLLGYAGTGKSMMQKALVSLLSEAKWTVRLSAPTGRAAKLLSEYTEMKATTIHKMMNEYKDDEKQESEFKQKLEFAEEDVLVFDESSMIDMDLMDKSLDFASKAKKLIFIGDPEQLPSVGIGKILSDLTESGIKTVALDKVFRQSDGGILDIATKIRNGKPFISGNEKKVKFGSDTIFHDVSRKDVQKALIYYMKKLMKIGYSLDDITVISPVSKWDIGVTELNTLVQNEFNPAQDGKVFKQHRKEFRIGDPILCTKNNYKVFSSSLDDEASVMNGEIGVFEGITKTGAMIIKFDCGHTVWTDASDLALGYVLTVHKMQGSANRAIIFIGHSANTFMLNRQLVYTAVTRAKEKLIIIGTKKTLNSCVFKDGVKKRNTSLAQRIKEYITKSKNKNQGDT